MTPEIGSRKSAARLDEWRFAASKVPQITLLFWVAKLLTTGMGETTWDWFDVALGQTAALTVSRILRSTTRIAVPSTAWIALRALLPTMLGGQVTRWRRACRAPVIGWAQPAHRSSRIPCLQ